MTRFLTALSLAAALVVLGVVAGTGCKLRPATNLPDASVHGNQLARQFVEPAGPKRGGGIDPCQPACGRCRAAPQGPQAKARGSIQKEGGAAVTKPSRNVLCLSGGGSFGAFTAGVLVGWSEKGDRPAFDVVTGISSGALIAPFAFLGPKYDPQMKQFFTTVRNRDIYGSARCGAIFGESFADNAPLAPRSTQC